MVVFSFRFGKYTLRRAFTSVRLGILAKPSEAYVSRDSRNRVEPIGEDSVFAAEESLVDFAEKS